MKTSSLASRLGSRVMFSTLFSRFFTVLDRTLCPAFLRITPQHALRAAATTAAPASATTELHANHLHHEQATQFQLTKSNGATKNKNSRARELGARANSVASLAVFHVEQVTVNRHADGRLIADVKRVTLSSAVVLVNTIIFTLT